MSGSEDEAEFASADEGEMETKTQDTDTQKGSVKDGSLSSGNSASSSKDTGSKQAEKPAARKKQINGGKGAKSKPPTNKGRKSSDTGKKEKISGVGKPKDSDNVQSSERKVSGKSDDEKLNAKSGDEKTVTDADSGKADQSKSDVDVNTEEHSEVEKSDLRTENITEADNDRMKLGQETSANLLKSPSSQSIQRPGPDHTQDQEKVLEQLAEAAKPQTGWGWGWGSTLMNVASTSVSTFTKEVGEGIHTMMETVESTLQVPAPEKLAEGWEDELDDNEDKKEGTVTEEPHHQPEPDNRAEPQKAEAEAQNEAADSMQAGEKKNHSDEGAGWFSSWGVSNITNIVQQSGKTFVAGGLDMLESIGKKTFDVIKDHDPGLQKTKGLFFERGNKPNLSQMLRDAKEQREVQERQQQESEEARKAHFGSLFDDFQGLAHLEALEMLSNQSEKKVSSLLNALPPETITTVKPMLLNIKENFEISEEEEEVEEQDFVRLVTELFASLSVGNSPAKLTLVEDSIKQNITELKEKLETETKPEPKEIHRAAIKALAELTSKSIEQFHKTGELMLIKKEEQTDLVSSSKHLSSLTKVLCAEVGIVSTNFTECLNKCLTEETSAVVNPLVTNVYLEATNSSSYIQDGFQLLLPVLQQTALEKTQEPDG